jgi:hypothetical protein
MVDSFLAAGGVSAVLSVLKYSTCSTTLAYTAGLIAGLMGDPRIMALAEPSGTLEKARELADEFWLSGGFTTLPNSLF